MVWYVDINQMNSIHSCPLSEVSPMPHHSRLLRPKMWPVLSMTSPATSQSRPMRGRQRTDRSCYVISAYWRSSSASSECSNLSHLMLSEAVCACLWWWWWGGGRGLEGQVVLLIKRSWVQILQDSTKTFPYHLSTWHSMKVHVHVVI